MSESADRERVVLAEIERELAARYPRLARHLSHPSWWRRAWWGRYHQWFCALLVIVGLSLIPLVIALTT